MPTTELAFGLVLVIGCNIMAEEHSLRQGYWQTRQIGSSLIEPGKA